MHEFPKPGNQLRNLWIKFVRRHRMADWQPSPYSCLCSAHFEPQCSHQRLGLGLEICSNITTKRLLHGKKRRARCSTGLNNVFLPTLLTLVNNIEQYC